ncbi:MAG: DUF2007 domain-containing protein [Oscillospiraceae bacterium]|nr:DUF2007 domain-containing protein [Oscillospiraceae bacterium]
MSWIIGGKKDKPEWPLLENGEAIPPAYLTHIGGGPMDMEMVLGLLEAYGIPHVCEYPNNGLFGKLILGHPPSGMEVYVPETMLEDAQNLISADIILDEDELEDELKEFEEES